MFYTFEHEKSPWMPFDIFTNAQYSWVKIIVNKAIVQAWKVGFRNTIKKFDALLNEKMNEWWWGKKSINQHHLFAFFP